MSSAQSYLKGMSLNVLETASVFPQAKSKPRRFRLKIPSDLALALSRTDDSALKSDFQIFFSDGVCYLIFEEAPSEEDTVDERRTR